MAIKFTLQGLLIYATMAAYLLAFVATVAKRKKAGQAVFFAGFCIALLSYLYRWIHVGHVPLQNLFEVFLSLGMLCYPISWFCRRVLRIGGEGADAIIAAIILFPAGFIFDANPQQLPPALQSWLFAPHVAVYMLAYVFLAKAAFWAVAEVVARSDKPARVLGMVGALVGVALTLLAYTPALVRAIGAGASESAVYMPTWWHVLTWSIGAPLFGGVLGQLVKVSREPDIRLPEQATYKLIAIGFPLLTLGLLLGSVWGKYAWGQFWGWDPKELWSLASWLVYVLYFHWRYMFGTRYPKVNSLLAILGLIVIVITLLWVNLSRLFPGMHSYAM